MTYLSVLLAETVERIRKNNLALTRSNPRARPGAPVGGLCWAGRGHRWESELATARRDLVAAWSDRFQTNIALNRLLHRPLEEGYQTSEVGLDDPVVMPSRGRVLPYIVTPVHFEVFREFNVEDWLARSPELAQLDAAITAQKRATDSTRRAFWSPEVALQAALDQVLVRSGEGSDGAVALPGLSVPDDTSWSIGLSASLPLWDGGERSAGLILSEETLKQLELQRNALGERIEQRIRSSIYVVNSS